MTPIGWIIIGVCIMVGVTVGNYIFKRFPKLLNRFTKDKKMQEVLKDPHLLVEKLKSSGKIYDMGKELDIKVGQDAKTGQDVIIVTEKESKRAKDIQKKVEKDKTQTKKKIKKDKKKVRKKQ